MRNERETNRRDSFLFWWPFCVQGFGFALGFVHVAIVTATPAKDEFNAIVIGFAGLAVTTGTAFAAQDKWNARFGLGSRSQPSPAPDPAQEEAEQGGGS